MIYFAISIFVFSLYEFFNSKKKFSFKKTNNSVIYQWIAIYTLVLFFTIRSSSVGTDTINYYKNMQSIEINNSLITNHPFEIGFQLLNFLIVKCIGIDLGLNVLFLISSFFMVCIANYVCNKLSKNISVSILLFIALGGYLSSFNQLRQCIAISILMLALVSILKKKPFNFYLLVIIAFLFHKSVIVFLPMYWIYNFKKRKILYIFILLFAIVFVCFNEYILFILNSVFKISYFDKYFKNGIVAINSASILTFIKSIISTVGLICLYVCNSKFRNSYNVDINVDFYIFIFYIAIIFNWIGLLSNNLFLRFVPIFYWIVMIALPNVIYQFPVGFRIIINKIVTICLFLYIIAITYYVDGYGIVPYEIIKL